MAKTSNRVRLTKRKIDAALFPQSGEIIIRDVDLPGFCVRITSGSKSFIVEKRIKGRLHKVTVGTYGPLTVHQGREAAREVLGKLLRGSHFLRTVKI